MRQMTWRAMGLADIARHDIGPIYLNKRGFKMRWMTWQVISAWTYPR